MNENISVIQALAEKMSVSFSALAQLKLACERTYVVFHKCRAQPMSIIQFVRLFLSFDS